MTAAAGTAPTLREIVLDALDVAYWSAKAETGGCRDCLRQPTGICRDHETDNAAAAEFDAARKQIEQQPDGPEVLAVLGTYDTSSGGNTDEHEN